MIQFRFEEEIANRFFLARHSVLIAPWLAAQISVSNLAERIFGEGQLGIIRLR